MSDSHNKQVSVVIPTYRRNEDLIRLLNSISKSTYSKSKLEIVVVDNAGEVHTEDVQSASGGISTQVLHPDHNLYCNGGRMYGAKRATGEYIFFIDDDNVLEPGCIAQLSEALDSDLKLGMAGPLMLILEDNRRIWAAGVKFNKLGLPIHQFQNKYVGEVDLPDKITGIHYFPNAFMLKREVLEKVPFDIGTFPHNWSEPDFGLRMISYGYSAATITKAVDWHDIDYEGHTTRTDSTKVYDQAKSRVLFRKRFFNTTKDWTAFWLVMFPASSLYYLKTILFSSEDKKPTTMGRYIKGTVDAIRTNIVPEKKPVHAANIK